MRKMLTVLLLLGLLFSFAGAAGASLIDDVQRAQGAGAIAAEIDRIGVGIVEFVRGIFAVLAVIFVIWFGFVYWGSAGNPQAMARAKQLAAGFIICIIGVYATETIVGGILGLLGYGS